MCVPAKKLSAPLAAHLSHAAGGSVSADPLQRRINVRSAARSVQLIDCRCCCWILVLCVTGVFTGAALCTCLHHAVGTLICSLTRGTKRRLLVKVIFIPTRQKTQVDLKLRLFCQTGKNTVDLGTWKSC